MDLSPRHRWMLTGTLVALVAGILARVLLKQQWREIVHRDPPDDPTSPDTPWLDALAWTAITGVVGGLASLVARRTAAGAWRLTTGQDPRKL